MSSDSFAIRSENIDFREKINDLREDHQIQLERTKKNNQQTLQQLRENLQAHRTELKNEHSAQAVEEIQKNDERLNEIKDSIQETEDRLNQSLRIQKKQYQKDFDDLQTRYSRKMEKTHKNRGRLIKDLNDYYNDQAQEINRKGVKEQSRLQTENTRSVRSIESKHRETVNQLTSNYRKDQESLDTSLTKKKAELKFVHEYRIREMEMLHQKELEKRKLLQEKEYLRVDELHKKKIADGEKAFQKKYNQIQKFYAKNIDDLKAKVAQVLNDIKEKHRTDIQAYDDKTTDQFYRFKTLDPIVEDRQDHYVISIKIPSYEKDFITMAADVRDITINFDRNFEDKYHQNNELNKLSRFESYQKKLHVSDILDDKNVTKNYSNGVLSFVIAKK